MTPLPSSRVLRPSLLPPSLLLSAHSTRQTGAWRLASSSPPRSPCRGQSTLKPRRKLWGSASTAEHSLPPCHTVCRYLFQSLLHLTLLHRSLCGENSFVHTHCRIQSPARSFAVPSSRVWCTGSTPPCPGSICSPGSTPRGTLAGRAPRGHKTKHCSRVSWVNGEADHTADTPPETTANWNLLKTC